MNNNADRHPCFNVKAKGKYGRVHLPIAPKCNIQCGYCNRKYDCVNESRPGVTSVVLSPEDAKRYFDNCLTISANLSTVGVAGPGDPMANEEETIKALSLIHDEHPDKIFCLSSNGLNLYNYIDKLAEIGVTHVTITINSVDPEIGKNIYKWVRYKKRVLRGAEAAKALMDEQLRCIPKLKKAGITVKINSIIIPGVNDDHIPEVAAKVKELGADIMNCMPLIPTEGTMFEDKEEPSAEMIKKVRDEARKYLPMMEHCQRCRSDAAGLLGCDNPKLMEELKNVAENKQWVTESRANVAVATYKGLLVNRHLGEADCFHIFAQKDEKFYLLEKRVAPKQKGDERWFAVDKLLRDCCVLLVGGVGERPKYVLKDSDLKIVKGSGLIEANLEKIYSGKPLENLGACDMSACNSGCTGNSAGGCCA